MKEEDRRMVEASEKAVEAFSVYAREYALTGMVNAEWNDDIEVKSAPKSFDDVVNDCVKMLNENKTN